MPLNLPTLAELRERIATDLAFRTGADAHTPGTGFTEIALVLAGIAHGLYANQRWIARQINVLECDDDGLLQRAATRGLFQIPPAFARGAVTVNGNAGAVISAATVLQHSDGRQYRTEDNAIIDPTGSTLLNVIALAAGVNGNQTSGALSFITPIDGVDGTATIATPLVGGADIEPVARVRERLADHLRQPPMGGKAYDYVRWAKEASVDVTRAWPFFHENGIGSITVRFVTEDLDDPIPTPAHIDQVAAYMDTVKPAGTRNFVVEAPTAVPLAITFTRLTPNTPEVQAAIEAEIDDLLRRESEPGGTIYLSHIREAISNAPGEINFELTNSDDIVLSDHAFAIKGVITWPGA